MKHRNTHLIAFFLRSNRIFARLDEHGIQVTSLRDATTAGRAITRVTGNTFPVRETLREMGARWNPTAAAWELPINHGKDWGTLVRAAKQAA